MSISFNDILEEQEHADIKLYLNTAESPEEVFANLIQYTNLTVDEAEKIVNEKFGSIDYEKLENYL